jgi:hypothetical protein
MRQKWNSSTLKNANIALSGAITNWPLCLFWLKNISIFRSNELLDLYEHFQERHTLGISIHRNVWKFLKMLIKIQQAIESKDSFHSARTDKGAGF